MNGTNLDVAAPIRVMPPNTTNPTNPAINTPKP